MKLQKLKIITFNILFDIYDKDLIFSDERYNEILKYLSNSNAHVIGNFILKKIQGLVEVTEKFLSLLLKEKWLREKYLITEIQNISINPYGQVILSKIPLRNTKLFHFSNNKRSLFTEMILNENIIAIVLVHLNSNINSFKKR
jgi:hypothetical protein